MQQRDAEISILMAELRRCHTQLQSQQVCYTVRHESIKFGESNLEKVNLVIGMLHMYVIHNKLYCWILRVIRFTKLPN